MAKIISGISEMKSRHGAAESVIIMKESVSLIIEGGNGASMKQMYGGSAGG